MSQHHWIHQELGLHVQEGREEREGRHPGHVSFVEHFRVSWSPTWFVNVGMKKVFRQLWNYLLLVNKELLKLCKRKESTKKMFKSKVVMFMLTWSGWCSCWLDQGEKAGWLKSCNVHWVQMVLWQEKSLQTQEVPLFTYCKFSSWNTQLFKKTSGNGNLRRIPVWGVQQV